ncbi:hypothetical protein ACS0TY_035962 [Phlomoides rotata]
MVPAPIPIVVREVWEENLEYELNLIRRSVRRFHIASVDTEFPGTVFDTCHIPKHAFSSLSPAQLYFLMKPNVDLLNLIQLGLTLSDPHGNLPTLGTDSHYVWQFNFRNFDPDRDRHDPEAISLLKTQGIVKEQASGDRLRQFWRQVHQIRVGPGLWPYVDYFPRPLRLRLSHQDSNKETTAQLL